MVGLIKAISRLTVLFLLLVVVFIQTAFSIDGIIDINSKNINIKTNPKRIIVIGPGALRLVTIMGLEDKLVGIERIERKAIGFSEYRTILGKKRIESLPIIGAGGPGKLPNLEKIIMLNPDIIIASFIDKKQLKLILNKTHKPIVLLSYGFGYGGDEPKLKAIKKSIMLLGRIFNKESRAKALVEFMKTQEEELKEYKIPNLKIYIGGIGYKGAHGITSTEKHYLPFELLGITNPLTKNARGNHLFVQEEALIRQDPDIIFLDMFGKKIIEEEFKNKRALYESLKAYKNRRIYWLLPYNFYNTNIANVYIDSWIILSRLGYNIDLKSKMVEIYNAFYPNGAEKLIKTRYPIKKFEWFSNNH
ncbi:ABC transporter substrate-binding protein [Hippea sp. KM1]|uniref:ABC transporter substrate-binding protein n=1 Tax=Hippea sp. KM1 TaxID=944481 RepID=UPI00046CB8DC|nr:ABC transporter substrate-binding protein [Hippea sp. KM1]